MKWEEVIKNPDYQKLSVPEKQQWRKEYFDDIVKPQIKPEQYDSSWNEFTADADKMEAVKSQPSYAIPGADRKPAFSDIDPKILSDMIKRGERDKGFSAAMNKGRYNSTTASLTEAYNLHDKSVEGIKKVREENWQPETRSEKIGNNIGAIVADLPLYAAGGVIGGPGGAFALPAALRKLAEEKEKSGGKINLDMKGVDSAVAIAKEIPKEWIKGELLGLAGKTGGVVADKLGRGILAKAAGDVAALPVETAALLGADKVLNNTSITADTILETLGTVGVLKFSGAFPGAVKTAWDTALSKGIPAEKIAENLKNEKVGTMQDEISGKEAIDRAVVMTEKQIEAERVSRIQNEIIDKQILSNYKDGKAPEQIIKLNQIPKEYRSYILDQTETGGWRFKPEVLEEVNNRINTKDPFTAARYEDVLPSPLRDMTAREGQRLADEHVKKKTELTMAKANLEQFEAQKQSLHESYMKDEVNNLLGNYRRFERSGAARDKMDQVIDYAKSVMTQEEQIRVANEPSALMDHIDIKESGYSELKPTYQDAVKKEIIAELQMKTGYIPRNVMESALRVADNRTAKEGKPYEKAVKDLEHGIKAISEHPDYQAHIKRNIEKSPYRIQEELKPKLADINTQIEKMKESHRVNYQKAMGESESFGEMNRSNAEYFGKDHMDGMMEFAVKTPEELAANFEKANFMDKEFKQKGWSPDMLKNKARVIASVLGDKVYRNFVIPLRQAEHNFVVESQKYKDWIKEQTKQFTPKERHELGVHFSAQMEQGKMTLDAMNARLKEKHISKDFPKWSAEKQNEYIRKLDIKLKDKYLIPKTFEELSPKQQEAVIEIRKIQSVMFERINAARAESGLDPLTKVEDYFTFIRKFSTLEELGYDPMKVSAEQFESTKISDFKTRGLAYQFGKERVNSVRDIETDAFHVLDKYLTSTLRTVHMTPVIGKLRAGLDINDKMALTNPNAHQYLHDTLDYVSGKKISESSARMNNMANWVNHNLGVFILTYNFNSAIIQPTAVVNTIGLLGPKAVGRGLADFKSSAMRDFAMEKSKVLKARMHDVTIEEMTKGFHGAVGKLKGKAADFGTLPLRYLDLKTAQITWLSGFRYGQDILKLTDREAVLFADDTVISSQGSAARIDLAPAQHTPLGKSLTLFNTFVINNLNFLTTDITGITKTNRLVSEGVTKNTSIGERQFIRMTGKNEYNVYEKGKQHSTREGLEKLVTLAAAGFIANTMYELAGLKAPTIAPVSAAYEGFTGQSWVDAMKGEQPDNNEGQLMGALAGTLREFASIVPIAGGSPRYGGDSVAGAVGGLVVETMNSMAGKPGSKPWWYLASKWMGVPGGQQVWKIAKYLSREEKSDEKDARKSAHPVESMKREIHKNNPYFQQRKEMRKQMRRS
jgi:hypothetical protein